MLLRCLSQAARPPCARAWLASPFCSVCNTGLSLETICGRALPCCKYSTLKQNRNSCVQAQCKRANCFRLGFTSATNVAAAQRMRRIQASCNALLTHIAV